MSQAKIKIKAGAVEIEFEGSEAFLKKEMPELLDTIMSLYKESKSAVEDTDDGQLESVIEPKPNNPKFKGTTATIAAKLNAKSAPKLLIAACTQLTLVEGKSEFSRHEITNKMKSASGYYKESMLKNLSQTLQGRLTAGELMEIKEGTFALSAEVKADLVKKLA